MKNVYCSLFGHDYRVTKHVTYHIKEYKCRNCKSEVTTGSNGELVPLTQKYREINKVLNKVHCKRLEKSRKLFMVNPL